MHALCSAPILPDMRTIEAADMGGLERHYEGDQIVDLFLG
jgi:hypothetical protein